MTTFSPEAYAEERDKREPGYKTLFEAKRAEHREQYVAALQTDNARLRALIKEKEWEVADEGPDMFCLWCHVGPSIQHSDFRIPHPPNCPAFNPDGSVK